MHGREEKSLVTNVFFWLGLFVLTTIVFWLSAKRLWPDWHQAESPRPPPLSATVVTDDWFVRQGQQIEEARATVSRLESLAPAGENRPMLLAWRRLLEERIRAYNHRARLEGRNQIALP